MNPIENCEKGIDLLVEGHGGIRFMIVTGKPKESIKVWTELKNLCIQSLTQLEKRVEKQ